MKHTSCRLSGLSNELKSNGDPFVRARVGEIPIEGTLEAARLSLIRKVSIGDELLRRWAYSK